jgi:hypothetical protein
MAYLTVTPRPSKQLAQFAAGVLGLRGGQAVAGDEDDAVGEGELHGGIVERDLAHHPAGVGRAGFCDDGTEAAEEDVGDGAVHGLAHEHGENEAGEAVEGAGDDEDVVAEHKAGGGGGQAGVGVEQRHDDGHVRRADGDDQHDAEDKGQRQHGVEGGHGFGMNPEEDEAGNHAEADEQVEGVLAAELDGLAGDDALQFSRRDQRAGGGERAEHDFKAQRAAGDGAHLIGRGDELADADQGRGQRAEGVRERGPLRHGGHGDADGHPCRR